jgi:heme-degrading monooxygenase HmoA
MFARLARYTIEPDRLEDAIASFREAGAGLRELPGFEDGYILVDEEDGSLLTLTVWSTRTALESSETRASALRRRAARAAQGSVQSIHCYELARLASD